MVARFALALNTTTDNLIGFKQSKNKLIEPISLRYTKRIKKIEQLPEHKIKTVLKTLDAMIKANEE